MRNSLRKLKRGRKSKQERREEERMRKKGRRGDFEVEVALTEVEEKEEVKGTVVRAHSSRRRGRERSTRCSLLEEIGKEVMVRVADAEEGNLDSSFTIFPEMEKQKSNLLPRFVPLANSNIFLCSNVTKGTHLHWNFFHNRGVGFTLYTPIDCWFLFSIQQL